MYGALLPRSVLAFAAALTLVGCDGRNVWYRSEAEAQASCPDDAVVAMYIKSPGHYVTKASWFFHYIDYQNEYGCYQDMVKYGIPCGTPHDVKEGPPPRSIAPQCYYDPRYPPL
jgi:hypothetical protein